MRSNHLKRIIEYLFYLFIFLLPWQTRFIYREAALNKGFWEYGSKSVYATEILLLLILLLYIIGGCNYFLKNRKEEKLSLDLWRILKNPNYIILPCLFLLWAGLSIFWAKDKGLAWYKWNILLEGIVIYLLVIKEKAIALGKIIGVFLTGVTVQAILGISQFLTQYIPANKWLGIAVHEPAELGTAVVETILRRWMRVYGSFPHPNILAAYLGAGLLLFISWRVISSQGKKENNFKILDNQPVPSLQENNFLSFRQEVEISYMRESQSIMGSSPALGMTNVERFEKINDDSFWGRLRNSSPGYIAGRMSGPVLLWIICVGILLTFSRSVWIALLFSLPFLLYKKFSVLKKILNPLNLSFFILFCALVFFLREPLSARIKAADRLEIKSIKERVSLYADGWRIIENKFYSGVGIGNYTLALHDLKSGLSSWDYQPIHNMYLMILAELGILGLILFLFFLANVFMSIIRMPSQKYILLSFFFFLMVTSLFDHYFWTLPSGIFLWWLIFGIIMRMETTMTRST